MISRVRIKALKSIKDMTIDCGRLNLIVGTNSAGKSTFLQALLLAAQKGLNGPFISLGEYREVRNYAMPDSNIKIRIWENGCKEAAQVEFCEDEENPCRLSVTGETDEDHAPFAAACFRGEMGLRYLSGHRVGPQDIYAKYFGGDNNLGIDGEYAFSYLMKHESDPVADELVKNREYATDSLYGQVNYWLEYIAGTNLFLKDIKKTNYLQVKYNNNPASLNAEAMHSRPVNVGSGVSYLVTILIICLASDEDDIILIENPEIHLHPKAQSRLCEFLYFISSRRRQLFVETHSDHIFNGVRVGISNRIMKEEFVKVHFFVLDEAYMTQCNAIRFGKYGKIIGTNDRLDLNDLFDQFEIDLDRMLGL